MLKAILLGAATTVAWVVVPAVILVGGAYVILSAADKLENTSSSHYGGVYVFVSDPCD